MDGQGRVREILKHNALSEKSCALDFSDRVDEQAAGGAVNEIDGSFAKLLWKVEYNTLGSITGFIDPKGNKRSYTYDTLQRMKSVDDPNVHGISYEYDDVGNLLRRTDALGQTQEFEYGLANA